MVLWLMILYHHARSGDKMFCSSEDIIQTFTNILNLCCDLNLEHSNPIFPQGTPAYDGVLSNQVWLQTDKHFRRYSKKIVIFWLYKPLLWPWPWRQQQQNVCHMKLRLMMLHHHTKFGNKMFCDSENIIQTNIHWHLEPSLWPWMQ